MRLPRITFFRIWYSSTFTVLFILIVCLLGATPADHVYQSIQGELTRTFKIQTIVVISGVYVLTFLVALFIYASRLYSNRTVLAGIPKWYIPIENGDIKKSVRKMIVKQLERSALISWDVRPRDMKENKEDLTQEDQQCRLEQVVKSEKRQNRLSTRTAVHISESHPPWGEIGHPGWSAPTSDDIPNLYFRPVIAELPNLIEAKAVSMAPPDLLLQDANPSNEVASAFPDARAVALLQRPTHMGLRAYLTRLCSFGLIDEDISKKFLILYEKARFSPIPLSESEFREIMECFSIVLAEMMPINSMILEEILQNDIEDSFSTDSGSLTPSTPAVRSHQRYHDDDFIASSRIAAPLVDIPVSTAMASGKMVSSQAVDANERRLSESTVSGGSVRRHTIRGRESPSSYRDFSEGETQSTQSLGSVIYSPMNQDNS